jgi:Tfp pilus assembly PilM family ATPase
MVDVFGKTDSLKGVYWSQDYKLSLHGNEPVDLDALCAKLKDALEKSGIVCHSVEPAVSF